MSEPPDRRAPVREVLQKRNLQPHVSIAEATAAWEQERFVARARALFYARMMFLVLGLLLIAVPDWSYYFGLGGPAALAGYVAMLLYALANYMVIGHRRIGRYVTYVTLCFDLVFMVVLIAKPHDVGGLRSPLLATQLMFTTLFVILFPKPLAIIPPLLTLPITTRLDLLLNRSLDAIDLFTLLWYTGLNFIIVYVVVYLNEREATAQREVIQLEGELRELAVVEERNRLSREIHDGLGASLSSLIIQSEYLMQRADSAALREEIGELKSSAEESIDELRRSLKMMREDFELGHGLEEYVKTFGERTQQNARFEQRGVPVRLAPDVQLTLFRVLQEALSNSLKHAQAREIRVLLEYAADSTQLTIADDGRGFTPGDTPPGHYGLRNLHERALKASGTLRVDASPGQGARIVFTVPSPRVDL